jgi:hypothetical protein
MSMPLARAMMIALGKVPIAYDKKMSSSASTGGIFARTGLRSTNA